MNNIKQKKEPEIEHLEWLVERRTEVQRSLLALYKYVRSIRNGPENIIDTRILNHLIAAAFSLWRAVFLSETGRDWKSVLEGQKEFLASVVSDNAITYGDDKRNRAWTVGYYLENAKLQLAAACHLASIYKKALYSTPYWKAKARIGLMGSFGDRRRARNAII